MINQFIALCFRRRLLVWVLTLLILVYGWFSWTQMTVEAYPDISDVTVQVTTQVPGLAAEEIEQQITTPLERALANTPGLVTMRSSSTFALSLITLVFKDGTDDYFARQRVTERLAQVTMPAGVQPGLDPISSPVGEIYRYTLESDTKNLMQLSEIQRWVVMPAFRQVPGIADVYNFGGFTKEFEIELDPRQLDRYGLALNDVVTAINNGSQNSGGGRISRGEQSYVVRGIGQAHSLDDLGSIAVATSSNVPVQLRELGKLQIGHQEREGILGKDSDPDTIEGIVLLLKGQNPSKVLEGVHAKVDELRKRLTPLGVKIVPYIDRDQLVKLTVEKGGTAYGPVQQTWRVAAAHLSGIIYYQSYGTNLAQDSDQKAIGGNHFGGAILSIHVGDTGPKLAAGQSGSDSGCRAKRGASHQRWRLWCGRPRPAVAGCQRHAAAHPAVRRQ